ncbi:cilia- and flagella-associated protein 70 [Halictus rubicundus]|uniref:cilia- and flagella-associated protein 70 n=1 Tax=Halictus rubicundus TaxID=77578 RepID=UPI004035AD24
MELQRMNSLENRRIVITLNTIKNIIRKEDIHVSFVVEHCGIILGESSPVIVKSTCEEELSICNIDFETYLPIPGNDRNTIDAIVSTPLLSIIISILKAFYTVEHDQEAKEDYPPVSGSEKKGRTIFTAVATPSSTLNMLGICNLDLMPLLLGEKCYAEKLVLETPTFLYDGSLVPWQNLPLLTAMISLNHESFFQSDETVNFLSITVESIYNLPESFVGNLEYKAGTIAYIDSEVPENLFFEHGTWTKYRDVERTKRWNTLENLENRARLSKYKLECDFIGLKNEFWKHIDFAKMVCEDMPRIEWNSVHRCVLWKTGIDAMENHIRRYKYWPFQFLVAGGDSPGKTKGSATKTTILYQCYVDLSELLFPGKKSCRVVGQLYTYNAADITEKVGIENNIFILETRGKDSKEREKKHKTSKHSESANSEAEVASTTALTSPNGQPTIIVIEVELYQPLITCSLLADYSNLINEMIPKERKKKPYVYSGDVAEKQYINCIQKLVEDITESYRDELSCFTQYLYKTGLYLSLRNTLRSKVTMLLDQKFKMPQNMIDDHEIQNLIVSVYTYLVEQMHVAINTVVEGRFTDNISESQNAKVLDLYAEEAYEFEDFDRARQYYKTEISLSKHSPLSWIKYAIYLKKIGDIERAIHCCLEAISLDTRYVFALLVYGAILFENGNYREAETFLRAVTDFYPRFYEGWAILHLCYIRTEYYPGIDLTLRIAEKCMKDKVQPIKLPDEPLAWSTTHCPEGNLYMNTAIFLLKLHLCELAGIALAQEMSQSNQSTHFLYYMAVEHYLSNRYEDALSHLEEVKCEYGMDYAISSLMGHCYMRMGDNEKAIECYEFARMLFDRPKTLHLVEVRLGYHYYNTKDYERAKTVFLSACKSSPTSHTWLGAGMSCYELGEFTEAEATLSEANRLDNLNPDIWGHLCLLNLTLRRYDEFCQCYREMIKNNLKNRKLWLRITNAMEALDYAPPILVTEHNDLVEDSGEEEFEDYF